MLTSTSWRLLPASLGMNVAWYLTALCVWESGSDHLLPHLPGIVEFVSPGNTQLTFSLSQITKWRVLRLASTTHLWADLCFFSLVLTQQQTLGFTRHLVCHSHHWFGPYNPFSLFLEHYQLPLWLCTSHRVWSLDLMSFWHWELGRRYSTLSCYSQSIT